MTPRTLAKLAALVSMCTFVFVGCGNDGNNNTNGQPQCSDGKDNDGDGMTDFPDDLGCTSPTDDSEDSQPVAQCMDGRDNDGDGKMDYPEDPGCTAPNQDDETDDCPTGPACPACSNGKDDDNNGSMDYPNDPGCTSAADPTEKTADPNACGVGLKIKELPTSRMDGGTFDATMSSSTLVSPCGEDSGAPAIAYQVLIDVAATMVATTNVPDTTADTVIDIRSAMCSTPASELVCNNDADPTNQVFASTAQIEVTPGTYYIIVKGQSVSETGTFALLVNLYKHTGDACTDVSECAPGATCRIPHGQAAMVCIPPVCSDGIDDDGDGKMDFPADPGCTSVTDDTEDDDCATHGPNCPACGDGMDNDGDGHTDYPADPSCSSASGGSESCDGEADPIVVVTAAATPANSTSAHDDRVYEAHCELGGFVSTGGRDIIFQLTIPAVTVLKVGTTGGIDTITSVFAAGLCSGASIACDDEGGVSFGDSLVTTGALAAGTYFASVDGYSSSSAGAYTFNVSGTLAVGSSCESNNTLNGALTCPTANPCTGTTPNRKCM